MDHKISFYLMNVWKKLGSRKPFNSPNFYDLKNLGSNNHKTGTQNRNQRVDTYLSKLAPNWSLPNANRLTKIQKNQMAP